jgi:hypothetical protein
VTSVAAVAIAKPPEGMRDCIRYRAASAGSGPKP